MWPNPKETEDLVTFTKEILNGKYYFFEQLVRKEIGTWNGLRGFHFD